MQPTQPNWLLLLFLILLLALSANALWLSEIFLVRGGGGIDWAFPTHYSVFVIALLAVIAYLLPFRFIRSAAYSQLIRSAAEIYPVTLIAFFLSKTIFFSLYSGFYGYLSPNLFRLLLVLLVLLVSFSIHFVTRRNLHRIRWGHGFFVAAGIITVVPLSILTVRFFSGFGEGRTFVDAIKMGYPYFWIVGMMGLLGTRTALWGVVQEQAFFKSDILDDLTEDD